MIFIVVGANAVTYLPDFSNFSQDDLLQLEDVGPKVAASIFEFFRNPDNLRLLKELEASGVNLKNDKKKNIKGGNFDGQTFLFTGSLTHFKRTEAEEMVEKNGGKLLGGVSSKLNFLIVGEDAGSKLEKAKKIPSIKVLTEQEFLQLIGK